MSGLFFHSGFIFSFQFVVPQMSAILLCRKGFTSASELVANTKYSKAKTLNFLQDQSERWVSLLSILYVKTAFGDVLGYEVMNINFRGNSLTVPPPFNNSRHFFSTEGALRRLMTKYPLTFLLKLRRLLTKYPLFLLKFLVSRQF